MSVFRYIGYAWNYLSNGKCEPMEHNKKPTNKIKDYLKYGISEYMGTTLLVLITCLGSTTNINDEGKRNILQESLTYGLALMTVIQIFGHISGAHVNPAVSLTSYMMDLMDRKMFIFYASCQFLGALTGSAIFLLVLPKEITNANTFLTVPNQDLLSQKVTMIEICMTFILCLSMSVSWNDSKIGKHAKPLKVGLVTTVCFLASAPLSGGSMNPVRSLAPAIWTKTANLPEFIIYFFGPLFGGAFCASFNNFMRVKPINKKVPAVKSFTESNLDS